MALQLNYSLLRPFVRRANTQLLDAKKTTYSKVRVRLGERRIIDFHVILTTTTITTVVVLLLPKQKKKYINAPYRTAAFLYIYILVYCVWDDVWYYFPLLLVANWIFQHTTSILYTRTTTEQTNKFDLYAESRSDRYCVQFQSTISLTLAHTWRRA